MKTCRKCKQKKPLSAFSSHRNTRDKKRPECRECIAAYNAQHRLANPDLHRHHNLKKNYGISLADYSAMLEQQRGRCAICKTDKPEGRWGIFCVDHDHATGDVRGLLCQSCNHGLGHFRDNPAFLASAIKYLSPSKRE